MPAPQNPAIETPLSLLQVNLGAIARNYLSLKKKVARGTAISAVVKADAYGLGAGPVAQTLAAQGCKTFFVATPDEGCALRKTLSADHTVYVLHGPQNVMPEDLVDQALTPVLCTPEDIRGWADAARRLSRRLPAVVHIDTGMNRLGLSARDVQQHIRGDDLAALDIRMVMSHLACADAPAHPMNPAQKSCFDTLSAQVAPRAARSLANSAGILLGPDYHYELVRPGCALYGLNPLGQGVNPFTPVVTLTAQILQVRDIDTPGTVGYGATAPVAPGMKTATVALGYADGFFRSLSGKSNLWVEGQACPVLGRVSMDSIVIDVTSLPTPVRVGDMAQVIGPAQSADALAMQAGTIGYEVLTSLGKRYKRVYTDSPDGSEGTHEPDRRIP